MIKKGKVFAKFIDYDGQFSSRVLKYAMIPEEYISEHYGRMDGNLLEFTKEGKQYAEKLINHEIDYIWYRVEVVSDEEIAELKGKRDKLNEILSLIE